MSLLHQLNCQAEIAANSKSFIVTYVESPEFNQDETKAISTIKIQANNSREAAKKALLLLPLPQNADTLQVHVCPEDLRIDAGFELFTSEELGGTK